MESYPLDGFGIWLWMLDYCEMGDVSRIIDKCLAHRISFIAPKATQGTVKYSKNWPKIKELATKAHDAKIKVIPWGWVYGRSLYPPYNSQALAESRMIIQVVDELQADAFILDAEADWKRAGQAAEVYRLMDGLSAVAVPILVSSYRYPFYHMEVPWSDWRKAMNIDRGDGWVPQIYWEQDFTPTAGMVQLERSYNDYNSKGLLNGAQYIPAPAAYKWNAWAATNEQVTGFSLKVKSLGIHGYLPWNWQQMGLLWEHVDSWYKPPTSIALPPLPPLPPPAELPRGVIKKIVSDKVVNVRKGPGTSIEPVLYTTVPGVEYLVYAVFNSWGRINKDFCEWVYLPLFREV